MERYYQAYDKRYQQIHEMQMQWASDAPSPIVGETVRKYGITPAQDILEVGCGEGRDAIWLLNQNYNVLASDVSAEAIRYCKAKAPQYETHFLQVDVCRQKLERKFDFIYAVAVLHMLVEQEDRDRFLTFFREHLKPSGCGLILTMGDGETERASDPSNAFENAVRTHQKSRKEVLIAETSCKMVGFPTFTSELRKNGLTASETGLTRIEPDFPVIMYAVVTADHE